MCMNPHTVGRIFPLPMSKCWHVGEFDINLNPGGMRSDSDIFFTKWQGGSKEYKMNSRVVQGSKPYCVTLDWMKGYLLPVLGQFIWWPIETELLHGIRMFEGFNERGVLQMLGVMWVWNGREPTCPFKGTEPYREVSLTSAHQRMAPPKFIAPYLC